MEDSTKVCPMCAETIRLEAKVCRFCRAQFEILTTGYCENCHAVRESDGLDHCVKCGSRLVDPKIESKLIPQTGTPPKTTVSAAGPKPASPAPAQYNLPPKKSNTRLKVLVIVFFAMICLVAAGVFALKFTVENFTPTAIPTRTSAPIPTNTARPLPTSTPETVLVTFDTVRNYPKGTPVIISGLLTLFKSTFCDTECGLLLSAESGSDQKITIFVSVAAAGVEPGLNQMKALPDPFSKWDIVIRLNDGNYAYIDNRITVTGRICNTTDGDPCIADIIKIELENR